MNRVEFMTELAALLQDVPEEERRDAMQYYNDYFDDAGEDREQEVIRKLKSPAKVAEMIKEDLDGHNPDIEFTDSGCAERQTHTENAPAKAKTSEEYHYADVGKTTPKKDSRTLKIILIIAVILIGGPIIIPVALGIAAFVFGCIIAVFAFFVGLVVTFVGIAVVGAVLICVGIVSLIPEIAAGLALLGTGLILAAVGAVGTVASIRLCYIVFPGMIRGIVWVCRRPFQKRSVEV